VRARVRVEGDEGWGWRGGATIPLAGEVELGYI